MPGRTRPARPVVGPSGMDGAARLFVEGELPEDGSGIDVAEIWRTVRRHVKNIKGWEVTEQVALATLPEEQRETVIMRIWSGMTLDEIAVATGVSLNTVASRYRYALHKLREKLKPFQRTEDL